MGKLRPATIVFCVFIFAAGAIPAAAQWGPDGAPVTLAAGNQGDPQVISDGKAGAIFLWRDPRGGTHNLYMQRLDAEGLPVWDAADVPIRVLSGSVAEFPHLAGDGAFGGLVAWRDTRAGASGVYVQRINSAGAVQWTADGSWLNSTGIPRIMADGANGAYVAWDPLDDVVLQRLDPYGVPLWAGTSVTVADDAERPRLVQDGDGGVFVGWQNTSFVDDAVFGDRLDATGAAQWSSHWVGPTSTATYFEADLAADGTGGAYWVWEQGDDVRMQRMDAGGAKLWYADGVVVNPNWPQVYSEPRVVADGYGGALVVYLDGGADVWLSRFGPDGTVAWRTAVCDEVAVQDEARLAPDGYGGAFVVWEDNRNSFATGVDIYAQHVDRDGVAQWTAGGLPMCNEDRDQVQPRIAATSNHSAVMVWEDPRISDLYVDIWAQVVSAGGYIGEQPFEVIGRSPVRNDLDSPPTRGIAATFSHDVDAGTVGTGTVLVHGSLTGTRGGALSVPRDDGLLFDPTDDFLPGEVVTVVLDAGIESTGGDALTPDCFTFTVAAEGTGGEFLEADHYGAGNSPFAICAADFNADGDVDLLAGNTNDDNLTYLRNSGTGSFGFPVTLPAGNHPHSVIAADLDGDRYIDVAIADYVDDDVAILLNDAGTGFHTIATWAAGDGPMSVCSGDFDGDGDLDLATANLVADEIAILFNGGTAKFSAPVAYAGGDNPYFIESGDLDGDGDVDLVAANLLSDDLSVFLNDGTGVFGPRTDLVAGDGANTVFPVDLDGDGDLDLVSGAGLDNDVLVFLNAGDATFAAPVVYATGGAAPIAGRPADVDGDGDLDLVYCHRNSDTVCVRLNDGSGAFGPEVAYATGDEPVSVVTADFDLDGSLDLATANGTSDDVSVLLNHHALSGTGDREVPAATALRQVAPNPFNPLTKISYALRAAGRVRLTVHDARGARVATLVDGVRPAGEHAAAWDGRGDDGRRAASGVYFARLVTAEGAETRKMALIK